MRAAILAAAVLASAGLLAGCGTRNSPRTLTTLHGGILEPTSTLELNWFARLGLTPNPPAATSVRADRLAESIRRAVRKPGVQIVSLRIYSTPTLTPSLAPALLLTVARPAYFLRHQLKPVLPLLTARQGRLGAYYLRIVDGQKKRVLEWTGSSLRGSKESQGSLYVRPGLEGCSPITALGWDLVPPCPSK